MISAKLQDALNAQINAEFWSAYYYLSMAVHFEHVGYHGVAHWYDVQSKEEMDHARILIQYLIARGGKVLLQPVKAVPQEWESVYDSFKDTLDHEEKVSMMYNQLYALAMEEGDYATRGKLDWFISEQVEEEANCRELLDRLKLAGDTPLALYQLDSELGSRVYAKADATDM